MQIKTAEIDVGRADNSGAVIADKHLGMDKSRRVFKNADACTQKLGIMGAGDHVDIPLVRYVRGDDAHINAALCSKAEGVDHLVVQNQIWRGNVDIVLCVV